MTLRPGLPACRMQIETTPHATIRDGETRGSIRRRLDIEATVIVSTLARINPEAMADGFAVWAEYGDIDPDKEDHDDA